MREKYFIDLFAGAGGLSEGFIQAGFTPVAHVEKEPWAAKTLQTRSIYHYCKKHRKLPLYRRYQRGEITWDELSEGVPEDVISQVICREMSSDSLPEIFEHVDQLMSNQGIQKVDVIIGGPPCQAYSLVGRAQSNHMLVPMKDDPRNELYKLYACFLQKYQPEMFVFENVTGLRSARGGEAFISLQNHLRSEGYEIEWKEQNAKNFGVLQSRRRIIIIGWKKGTDHTYPSFKVKEENAVVNDVLNDLAPVGRGETNNSYAIPFDECSEYLRRTKIRTQDDIVTGHICRPNNDRDVEIYRRVIELWNEGHLRLNYRDLPDELKTHNNQSSFTDRFKVVEGDSSYCHTVLSHLSRDGHYFIHPDIGQCRSITPREAARIQSFPDSYIFEGNRGQMFVQIGNAVPPLMAKEIAKELMKQL